jgi:DNA-binding transcriptional MerR regulator
MNRAALALERAVQLLAERLAQLEAQIRTGDDVWPLYVTTAQTLGALLPAVRAATPEPLLTTRQLADRLGVTPRTIRKLKREGRLQPVQQLAKRGPAANRWAAP